jgi:C1A family cysteine protease
MGVNQFTDQTPQELAEKYLNNGGRRPDTQIIAPLETLRSLDELPPQLTPVDWVAMGKVTPVKAQGDCGSCYAFSSVASLESAVLIANRPEQHFSEQQLMECSSNYGNAGCHGGYFSSSFNYMTAKGIATDREYPYSGITWPCQFQGGTQKTKGYVAVSGCQDLYNVLTKIPVSVGVAAAATWFQYKSGVMTTCATSPIDHYVLLVGATDQYWTIKNSWGTGWGESGFIRLALGGTCGICTAAAYVVIL